MESAQAVVAGEEEDGGGATKLKKPSGPPVARGTHAGDDDDDGGGGRHLAAPRVDAKNWNSLVRAASTSNNASSESVGTATNGFNSALLRRRRLKRNPTAAAVAATAAAAAVTSAKMKPVSLLRVPPHPESGQEDPVCGTGRPCQLQPADREWLRADLHRGSVHVHDRLAASSSSSSLSYPSSSSSYPRPVLCTMDTTAGEMALGLSKPCGGKSGSVLRIFCKDRPKTDQNGNCDAIRAVHDTQQQQQQRVNTDDDKCDRRASPLKPAEFRDGPFRPAR